MNRPFPVMSGFRKGRRLRPRKLAQGDNDGHYYTRGWSPKKAVHQLTEGGGRIHRPAIFLQRVGFMNPAAFHPAIDNLVKETEQIGQIDPEPAVEAAGVDSPAHESIVPLDHHKPSASEAMHRSSVPPALPKTVHDQSQTTREQSPTENRRSKGCDGVHAPGRISPFEKIANAPLDHKH